MRKVFICILLFLLCACSTNENTEKEVEQLSVSGNIVLVDDNGNADVDITNTDLLAKGFKYGDSVDVELENGFKLEDVAFLSGMYVEYGEAMVYGKASKDKVSFIQKYKSFSETSNAQEEMTYTITLNEAAKYLYIEEVGNLSCTNDLKDYTDEAVFSNFREVKVGDIKEHRLYRSSSVIDNSANRRDYSAKLALYNGIKTIINTIDKEDAYNELLANLEGDSKTLIENTTVINAPISNDYQSEKNNKKIIEGLNELIQNELPCLIHCLEGKDRIGYELAIIEALCNASYQEIVDDYMLTYQNYYGITKENDSEKYNYIKETNIDAMLKFITGTDELEEVNTKEATKSFLINYGMDEANIDSLINKLCN